jgi:long-chain-fatty-acid--CoA ligase ACSBG
LAENREHLAKYLKIWSKLPKLKYVVLWADTVPTDLPEERKK